MISKTQISKRMRKKTNPELAEAIHLAKKAGIIEVARAISVPTRKQAKINVEEINKRGKESAIVPGKVLGAGKIERKIKVYALSFSAAAKEKLEKAGCEIKTILEALRKGEKIQGEILR